MKKIGSLKYFRKIKAAYEGRPEAYKTDIFALSVVIAVIVFIFITFSVFLHPGGTHFSYNFTSEQGSITILSATTLTTASLLAYACFFIKSPISRRQKIFFLLAALALTYLAVDEVAQFHENGGLALDHIRKFRKMIRWSGIHSWNDMIIIIYGILALPVLLYFIPSMVEIPYIAEYFCVSFACYVVHTTIDVTAKPPTAVSNIFEESAKIYTSTFMAIGLLSALIFLIYLRKQES